MATALFVVATTLFGRAASADPQLYSSEDQYKTVYVTPRSGAAQDMTWSGAQTSYIAGLDFNLMASRKQVVDGAIADMAMEWSIYIPKPLATFIATNAVAFELFRPGSIMDTNAMLLNDARILPDLKDAFGNANFTYFAYNTPIVTAETALARYVLEYGWNFAEPLLPDDLLSDDLRQATKFWISGLSHGSWLAGVAELGGKAYSASRLLVEKIYKDPKAALKIILQKSFALFAEEHVFIDTDGTNTKSGYFKYFEGILANPSNAFRLGFDNDPGDVIVNTQTWIYLDYIASLKFNQQLERLFSAGGDNLRLSDTVSLLTPWFNASLPSDEDRWMEQFNFFDEPYYFEDRSSFGVREFGDGFDEPSGPNYDDQF